MATNFRFMYDNLIDYTGVTITAATEDDDLPVENVQHPQRTKVYRTGTSQAAETIVFDLGSAKAVQALVVLDHDLTSSDTLIKIQAHTSDSWGAPTINEAVTYHADTMTHVLSVAETYRYWRFIFTKSAAGETRDIGRIFLGPLHEVTKNFKDLDITPHDLSETGRSIGGQTYSDARDIYYTVKTSYRLITDTQMGTFRTIAAAMGTHTPFFISVDHTNEPYDYLFYCKFTKFGGRKAQLLQGGVYYWDTDLEFAEEL